MTDTWSEARHHLERGLKLFIVVDIAGIAFGIIQNDWWLADLAPEKRLSRLIV